MSYVSFDILKDGYYVIEEKIAKTKHIVQVQNKHAQFFGTKREPLSEMDQHYNVVDRIKLEIESRSVAPRTS